MVADYSQVMRANDNWARRLQEGIENYSGIKGLNAEEEYQKIYEKEVRGFVSAVRIANRTAHTETGLKSGMNQFSNYVGYIAAGLFAVSGRIGLATVARTVLLISLIQNILSLVMGKYVHRRNVIVSKQRLMDLAGKGTGGEKEPDFVVKQWEHAFGAVKQYENKRDFETELRNLISGIGFYLFKFLMISVNLFRLAQGRMQVGVLLISSVLANLQKDEEYRYKWRKKNMGKSAAWRIRKSCLMVPENHVCQSAAWSVCPAGRDDYDREPSAGGACAFLPQNMSAIFRNFGKYEATIRQNIVISDMDRPADDHGD